MTKGFVGCALTMGDVDFAFVVELCVSVRKYQQWLKTAVTTLSLQLIVSYTLSLQLIVSCTHMQSVENLIRY